MIGGRTWVERASDEALKRELERAERRGLTERAAAIRDELRARDQWAQYYHAEIARR